MSETSVPKSREIASSDAESGTPESESGIGDPVERREDPRMLTGRATYIDDVEHPNMVHAAILRSQHAHARINEIDTSRAEESDEVIAVFTWSDVEAAGVPGTIPRIYRVPDLTPVDHKLLAEEKARYQGRPMAVVVAEDRYAAQDALDLIDVDYERLDAVIDPVEATAEDAPTIHDGVENNVVYTHEMGDAAETDAKFEAADEVFEFELENQRVVPAALSPRGVVAKYDNVDDELTVHIPSQTPFTHQEIMADVLGHAKRKIRIVTPDVGGGFGSKSMFYPSEALVPFVAMQLDRPVKWIATRSESFVADDHGRGQVINAEVAVTDNQVQALRVLTHGSVGGELGSKGVLGPTTTFGLLLSGQYDIPAIHFEGRGVLTNAVPTGVYRGVGRAESMYTVERVMEITARRLGEDPTTFRRRHFIESDEFPFETPVGALYDSGDYEKSLDKALDIVDYEALRDQQRESRDSDSYLGVGIACFIESGGFAPSNVSDVLGMGLPDASVRTSFWESGTIRVHETGEVSAYVGTASTGTGIETTHSQIISDKLGVDIEDISLEEGKDTEQTSFGTGSIGSRGGPVGGGVVSKSIDKVIEKGRRIVAHQFDVTPEDVEFENGEFHIAGAPDRSMTLEEVAGEAYLATKIPDDMEPGLEATSYYDPENFTFAFGTHIAVVEVDAETGEVTFDRYVAVDDCGNQINPMIVEGQIVGGVAQGIGQARYEGAVYDGSGNLVTSSFQDYTIPRAIHLPEIEVEETVTPSPHNPLGVKGVAESGTVGATPAVANAITDALSHLGVEDLKMPITDQTVWDAIQDASGGED
jgi:carbon-monoxide dehydrogenase large subunit